MRGLNHTNRQDVYNTTSGEGVINKTAPAKENNPKISRLKNQARISKPVWFLN